MSLPLTSSTEEIFWLRLRRVVEISKPPNAAPPCSVLAHDPHSSGYNSFYLSSSDRELRESKY